MKRVDSFIPGLERLIGGGFPKSSAVLVQGGPGTGKTLLGLQYLYHGCKNAKDAGMLIQTEEFGDVLGKIVAEFGWDFGAEQKKGRLALYAFKSKDYPKFRPVKIEGEMLSKLRNIIEPMGVKRVVVDSITPLRQAADSESEYRTSLYYLIEFFKSQGITSLILSEGECIAEEHICDGVIKLRMEEKKEGVFERELRVCKLLGTNHKTNWYSMGIGTNGITVRPFR